MIRSEHASWLFAACAALLAGLYFRLSGFGIWPLAVDEYYVYRAMTFVLDTGLPQFPCGGYYSRGLVYQYLTVPLLYFDLSPEAGLRAISIISNLLMLPAAYLLARRIGGSRIAAAVVIILALSTWEIEMSRFGRMYAPFQMLFMWYVYHAYRLVTEQNTGRWRWLLALSIIGPFVWEGAIVLAVFNFVPFVMNRKYGSARHFVGSILILIASVGYLNTDFRFSETSSTQSSSDPEAMTSVVERMLSYLDLLVPTITESPILMITFLGIVTLLVVSVCRALLRASLSAAEKFVLISLSVSLIANQILLMAFVLISAGLVGWIRTQTLRNRDVIHAAIMMLVLCSGFLLIAILGDYGPTLTSRLRVLIGFPDILYTIVYPWLFNIPVMTVMLGVLVVLAARICLTNCDSKAYGLRLLIVFVLIAVAIIGVAPSKYHETRYSFFLYPLLVCISGYAIAHFSHWISKQRRSMATMLPVTFVLVFMVSSDFAAAHLARIDSYEANYRIGYSDHRSRHYYPRTDFRSASEFVNEHSSSLDRVIISSVVFAQYLNEPGFVYLDKADGRYNGQACNNESIERWTNLPLINSISELSTAINHGESGSTWLVVDNQISTTGRWAGFLEQNPTIESVYESRDGQTTVYQHLNQ